MSDIILYLVTFTFKLAFFAHESRIDSFCNVFIIYIYISSVFEKN